MSNVTVAEKKKQNRRQPVSVRGTPIIVYQMGKVGSSTILGGLRKRNLPDSVHHIHVLAPQTIAKSKETILSAQRKTPEQLLHSRLIRDYLDTGNDPAINVITAVREPVAQKISSIFQNIHEQQPHLIAEDGSWREHETEQFVRSKIESYNVDQEWNCNWFDKDFLPALGVDVYQHPFDQESGVATVSKGNCRILILRLESSENWVGEITRFLDFDSDLKLVKLNDSSDKDYKSTYRNIINRLKFSEELLDTIYGTRFCQHFYSLESIEAFKQRWRQD